MGADSFLRLYRTHPDARLCNWGWGSDPPGPPCIHTKVLCLPSTIPDPERPSRATQAVHMMGTRASSAGVLDGRRGQKLGHSRAMGIQTAVAVLMWYTTNIGVILLNKYLLSVYGFRFPILLTLFHMVSCTLCSASVVLFGVVPLQKLKSTKHTIKVATLAFVFCCSIVAGNVSLRFIPVSFSQAIGATTPIFTAIFAAMFGRIESGRTYLALIPIVIGIVLASRAEPNFHVVGFSAAVVATAGRAFKSVLQSLLLTSNDEQLDSMNLLMYMSPIAALMLLPATVVMEEGALSQVMELGSNNPSFVLLLLLNALFAFLVNLYNFLVTRYTSALTLQVLGNAKGVLATFISVLIFKNKITVIGLLGYGIAIAGVVLYSNEKKRTGKERTHTLEKVRVGHS